MLVCDKGVILEEHLTLVVFYLGTVVSGAVLFLAVVILHLKVSALSLTVLPVEALQVASAGELALKVMTADLHCAVTYLEAELGTAQVGLVFLPEGVRFDEQRCVDVGGK